MTLIIAEVGVNHNGDINLAKKLIKVAYECGADIVKFQLFRSEELASKNSPKAEYQILSTNPKESQYEMLKSLELSSKDIKLLQNECIKVGIEFLCTPFDLVSLKILQNNNVEMFKIPSGEITNKPLLKKIGSLNKKTILSTGMSNLGEIEEAIEILENAGIERKNIVILHCTTEYPAPYQEVNLNAIKTLMESFKVAVGYSDHTEGIIIPIAATAIGAKIIEKHLTLDKTLPGPDHKASLNPEEFAEMVKSIRIIERSLGSGIKKVTASEKKNILIARKSIVAYKNIKKGEYFSEKNLALKRPGNGLSPTLWDLLIGKKSTKNYQKDDQIQL
jgi:N,N'-diacetyllegionaminate synthase